MLMLMLMLACLRCRCADVVSVMRENGRHLQGGTKEGILVLQRAFLQRAFLQIATTPGP
jgi:hypothetical protein